MGCAAGVYRAALPREGVMQEIERNPHPEPGAGEEDNPYLLRLLMSPECVRPECGIFPLTHEVVELVVTPEESESELFQS